MLCITGVTVSYHAQRELVINVSGQTGNGLPVTAVRAVSLTRVTLKFIHFRYEGQVFTLSLVLYQGTTLAGS